MQRWITLHSLAILGSRPVNELNMDAFQNWTKTQCTTVSLFTTNVLMQNNCQKWSTKLAVLPFSKKGPAVVWNSVNFGFKKSTKTHTMDQVHTSVHSSLLLWTKLKSTKLLKFLNNAERPVIYAGYGGVKAGEVITGHVKSKHQSSQLVKTLKPLNGAMKVWQVLLTVLVGSQLTKWSLKQTQFFSLVQTSHLLKYTKHSKTLKNSSKWISTPYKLGKRHALDASILGDAGQAAKAILDKVNPVESTPWWRANVKNNQNWRDYMNKLEGKTEGWIAIVPSLQCHQQICWSRRYLFNRRRWHYSNIYSSPSPWHLRTCVHLHSLKQWVLPFLIELSLLRKRQSKIAKYGTSWVTRGHSTCATGHDH